MDEVSFLRGLWSNIFSLDWERSSQAVEIAQGKAIADAAVAADASLLIWSSLPHISKISKGKFTGLYHFDSKAEVEIYIRGLPIKSLFYMAGFYMQNFQTMFRPKLVSLSVAGLNVCLYGDRNVFRPFLSVCFAQ